MNDADRKAFEEWWTKNSGWNPGNFDAWEAACEWRDSQVGEPIGWRVAFTKAPRGNFQEGKPDDQTAEYWRNRGINLEYCYAAPSTAQINQQLAALLEKSLHWLDGLCDAGPLGQQYPSDELTQFVEDIRAALAATQMRGDA